MQQDTTAWSIEPAVEIATARTVLSQDRIANAYALSDLEPPYDGYSSVAIARRDGVTAAACLVVHHPSFTGLVTHGASEGVRAILGAIDLPETTHLDLPEAHRPLVEAFYDFADPHRRRLMAVTAPCFRPASRPPLPAVRLDSSDLPDLLELYAGYAENAFHPDQLAYGVFCGVRDGGRLVAAAGTPGLALQSGIAIVTSVFTRPEARNRGLGAAVTSAVTAVLFALGCYDVCLDVELSNAVAIRLYERLGFRLHSLRWQGMATRRG